MIEETGDLKKKDYINFFMIFFPEMALSGMHKQQKLNPNVGEDLELDISASAPVEALTATVPVSNVPASNQPEQTPAWLVHYTGDKFYLGRISQTIPQQVWYCNGIVARTKTNKEVIAIGLNNKNVTLERNGWQDCNMDHVLEQLPPNIASFEDNKAIVKCSEEIFLNYVVQKVNEWIN